jgi:nicotinamide mononucleotide transporter
MTEAFEILFGQYSGYSTFDILLEAFAAILGLSSVYFSMRGNILVYPTGIISTAIYVYILYFAGLFGDMSINAYYVAMSIYGWYKWTRKSGDNTYIPIRLSTKKEKIYSVFLFFGSFVVLTYILKNHTASTVPYIDAFTTSIFFVGMWLMAKKILDNWVFWIIGDLVSIPLYIYKGLTITSLQYVVFTILAIKGFIEWKRQINMAPKSLLR